MSIMSALKISDPVRTWRLLRLWLDSFVCGSKKMASVEEAMRILAKEEGA